MQSVMATFAMQRHIKDYKGGNKDVDNSFGFEIRQWVSFDPLSFAPFLSSAKTDSTNPIVDNREYSLGLSEHCRSDMLSYWFRLVSKYTSHKAKHLQSAVGPVRPFGFTSSLDHLG